MVRSILAVCLLTIGAGPAPNTNTGWLDSSHPQIKLLVERTARPDCVADCDRYLLVLSFRASAAMDTQQRRDAQTFIDASCVDFETVSERWFACRLPGALSVTAKQGGHYATMRFRVRPQQVQTMANATTTLRIQSLNVTLPQQTRTVIAEFLRLTT